MPPTLKISDTLSLPIDAAKAERLEKQRAYNRLWRARNREKLRAYYANYRASHPELKQYHAEYFQAVEKEARKQPARMEATKKRSKIWRDANRPKCNKARRDWVERNPERARAIETRRREKRRPKKRIADAEYRRAHPEIYKESIARAKAAKPELYKKIAVASTLRRRARKRNVIVERVSLKTIALRDGGVCHLCFRAVAESERSFDHLIPIVRNGAHAEWNLMLTHLRCNKSRGIKQILASETKEEAELYISAHAARLAHKEAA